MKHIENFQLIADIFIYGLALIAGLFLFFILVIYLSDKLQTTQTIRHNFPVIGRLRYVFEHWGIFFRQYFFAQDREEMPFNRAQRSWVYRAAKDIDTTVAFGSSRNPAIPGSVYFSHAMYPALGNSNITAPLLTVGPQTLHPYQTEKFFHISAMSFGAISVPAVKALSLGAKQAGIWLNTGEGGLSPYHLEGNCDLVFQIGTGKFGVRDQDGNLSDEKLAQLGAQAEIKMFELKLSQGAKPGKGGILPAVKVSHEIARIRGITTGTAAISPNRFSELESHNDLINMIDKVRTITGKPTGIKLCIGNINEFETLCQAIVERSPECAPDFITVDSSDGGTGAAPMTFIDSIGMLLSESLPQVVDLLIHYGLRDRVRVIASGKLINPVDVAWALCAGADFVNNARGFMFSLGCIQAMQCNKNTCPTGITTHNAKLQAGLNPTEKSYRVAHYADNMVKEVQSIAHSCGVQHPRELNRSHARIVMSSGVSTTFSGQP